MINYISKNLMRDETIISISRPHWIIFFKLGFLLFLSLLFLQIGPYYPITNFRILYNIPPMYKIVSAVLLFLTIQVGISTIITFLTTELSITNKRVVFRTGLIRRKILEILLTHIESISVDQSLLGRALNYGTLLISGTGGSKDFFLDFPAPVHLCNNVQEQIEYIINKHTVSDS